MTGTVGELRRFHRQKALDEGLNPRDVDLLLADELGRSVTYLVAHGEESLAADSVERFESSLARRRAGEPIQYIRGKTEFYSREFFVDPRVLIPRPETELVVEALLEVASRHALVLDVGTGSGCIAVSVQLERRDLVVIGSDRDLEALAVASRNVHALDSRVHLVAMDLLDSVGAEFDLIVSNPPYIPTADLEGLEVQVRAYEPRAALTSGPTGLETIERLLGEAARRVKCGGRLVMEIGWGQSEAVVRRAGAAGWKVERIIDDFAAIPRVVVLGRD
ncbi:MAG TPA: peptide chain release factor N(5)-glutamine methyltransferase [Thermoanaerobaculia bacterium]|nr:peptide chain release factor N(5)-glutamine methyltransferase [Thermoanaerobaculia bacterium]